MLVIEMLKMNCPDCSKDVWAFIRSQEEFTNFRCTGCFEINNTNINGQNMDVKSVDIHV